MEDFIVAVGLVLILEGMPYFIAPTAMRQMVARMMDLPDRLLRQTGLVLMVLGLFVIYLVRG